jgi:threonine dehydrogenase-like Zn-dependent dehydrogenase
VRYQAAGTGRDRADIVIEATGSEQAPFAGLDRLEPNGVLAVLGARQGHGPMPWHRMILNNLTVLGSVNASLNHFKRAVKTIGMLERRALNGIIARAPRSAFLDSVRSPQMGEIKTVHVLAE